MARISNSSVRVPLCNIIVALKSRKDAKQISTQLYHESSRGIEIMTMLVLYVLRPIPGLTSVAREQPTSLTKCISSWVALLSHATLLCGQKINMVYLFLTKFLSLMIEVNH